MEHTYVINVFLKKEQECEQCSKHLGEWSERERKGGGWPMGLRGITNVFNFSFS